MKKYIVPITLILCLLCGMAGCINEDIPGSKKDNEIKVDKNSVVLTLQNSKNLYAEEALPNNEDKLNTVSVFFFDPATKKLEFFKGNVEVDENKLVTIPLESNMNGKNLDIYVIANYDITTDKTEESEIKKDKLDPVVGETTLEQLKSLVLTTIFNRDENGIEPSFVMDGIVQNVKIVLGQPISQTIKLERVAARIQLFASFTEFKETVNGVEHTYTPRINGEVPVKVTMYNGIGRTTFSSYKPKTEDIVNPRVRTLNSSKSENLDGVEKEYYFNTVPLYSYANDWSGEVGTSMATYLELAVSWHHTAQGVDENKTYYYQVPVSNNQKLERNNAYQIHVDISMMGSEVPTETVVLEGDVEVISWTDIEFDAVLNRYKYLSVDPQVDTLRNVPSAQFKYSSSSPISVSIEEVSYINYSTSENALTKVDNPTANGFKAYIVGNEIYFEHKINKTSQFFPYTIKLRVSNTDEGVDDEIITIVQYPAIYVSAEEDEEYRGEDRDNRNRFVYNVWQATRGGQSDEIKLNGVSLGRVLDLYKSEDQNPNQYNISVTAFDETDKLSDGRSYMIGDPREESTKTVLSQLKYYRGTKTDRSIQNMIAPIYKIASSWGGTSSMVGLGFEAAQTRCAAYQENGYPAGRWRVPTEAEIEYIVNLSSKNQIPALFYGDGGYYAASGKLWSGNKWGDSAFPIFVRCVYDVWYWGDEKISPKDEFKWGDNPDGSLRGFNE